MVIGVPSCRCQAMTQQAHNSNITHVIGVIGGVVLAGRGIVRSRPTQEPTNPTAAGPHNIVSTGNPTNNI